MHCLYFFSAKEKPKKKAGAAVGLLAGAGAGAGGATGDGTDGAGGGGGGGDGDGAQGLAGDDAGGEGGEGGGDGTGEAEGGGGGLFGGGGNADDEEEEEAEEELHEATKDVKTEDLFLHLDPEEAERIRMDRERGGRPKAVTRYVCRNPCKAWCMYTVQPLPLHLSINLYFNVVPLKVWFFFSNFSLPRFTSFCWCLVSTCFRSDSTDFLYSCATTITTFEVSLGPTGTRAKCPSKSR